MRSLEPQEREALVGALPQLRDRVFAMVGLLTGFRAGEIVCWRVGDVWRSGRVPESVTIHRRSLKGGRRTNTKVRSRTVPLHAHLRTVLSTYLQQRYPDQEPVATDYLFQSQKGENAPILAETARKIIKHAARTVGLDGPIGTHSLRKSFAHDVYEGTGHDLHKLKKALGHASINTTDQYLDASERSINDAILAIGASTTVPFGAPQQSGRSGGVARSA